MNEFFENNVLKVFSQEKTIVLPKNQPRSLITLYREYLESSNKRISIQGFHKKLRNLVKAGILIKEDKMYKISKEWFQTQIKKLKEFV